MSDIKTPSKSAGNGALASCGGYTPGHPWYYKLGGKVLGPKSILNAVIASGYQGYLVDDIDAAASMAEPVRSTKLRKIKDSVLASYQMDLKRYRILAQQLRRERNEPAPETDQPVCADVNVNISLKHNHLYNDLAHLHRINNLLSVQRDLFDGL